MQHLMRDDAREQFCRLHELSERAPD
jgi:hypothetical protein